MQPATLGPVTKTERIQAMDILRGFALLGILVVNIMGFSGYEFNKAYGGKKYNDTQAAAQASPAPASAQSVADTIADFCIETLFASKSFTLFSFLFGLGFAVQLAKAQKTGAKLGGFYARRLAFLLAFGLAHHLLLWEGEILKLYAALGFLLLAFRKAKPRTLLIWAITLWAVFILGAVLVTALSGQDETTAQMMKAYTADMQSAYSAQGWIAGIAFRFKYLGPVSLLLVVGQGLPAFAMFLLGLLAGKEGWATSMTGSKPVLKAALISGVAGLAFGATAWYLQEGVARMLCFELSSLTLTFFYIGCFSYLAGAPLGLRLVSPLAWAGRMALTNYVLQSVLCNLIFYGFGLGLFGRTGPAANIAIAFAIWLGQLGLSALWLARFRFGPLEWAWRSLTYGKLQPMLALEPAGTPKRSEDQ